MLTLRQNPFDFLAATNNTQLSNKVSLPISLAKFHTIETYHFLNKKALNLPTAIRHGFQFISFEFVVRRAAFILYCTVDLCKIFQTRPVGKHKTQKC
jgi:hypothetical protein